MATSCVRRVDWVTLNFVISVWVLIGGVIALLFINAAEFAPLYGEFAPFGGHILRAALSGVAIEALLWVFVYRNADKESRWAAGLMGGLFAIKAAISPLYSWALVPFYGYVSASHIVFAIRGRS